MAIALLPTSSSVVKPAADGSRSSSPHPGAAYMAASLPYRNPELPPIRMMNARIGNAVPACLKA
jgi:hypothetical protein